MLTYRALDDRVRLLTQVLRQHGIGRGRPRRDPFGEIARSIPSFSSPPPASARSSPARTGGWCPTNWLTVSPSPPPPDVRFASPHPLLDRLDHAVPTVVTMGEPYEHLLQAANRATRRMTPSRRTAW